MFKRACVYMYIYSYLGIRVRATMYAYLRSGCVCVCACVCLRVRQCEVTYAWERRRPFSGKIAQPTPSYSGGRGESTRWAWLRLEVGGATSPTPIACVRRSLTPLISHRYSKAYGYSPNDTPEISLRNLINTYHWITR